MSAQLEQQYDDGESPEAKASEQRRQALDDIGQHLEILKDKAVTWRTSYELEWMMDYRQYSAASNAPLRAKQQGAQREEAEDEAYRATVDNITRPKVVVTASRLGDMLFPTNDANWSLDSTPNPDVPDERIQAYLAEHPELQQTELTRDIQKQLRIDVAREAARGMSEAIDDQLQESQYAEIGRSAIFDASLYGTGVVRSPVLKTRRRHTFKPGDGYRPQMVQQAKPSVVHVDLWSFYPQPSRSIKEAEHVFRLDIMSPSAVRALAHQPGFDRHQIARLLEQEPVHGAVATTALDRGIVRPDSHDVLTGRYTVWEYSGPMPKPAIRAFLESLTMDQRLPLEKFLELSKEIEEDPMTQIDCDVWMCQGIVLKVAMSTRAPGDLGYRVYNYEKDPNSIFGHGVAFLCRDDQIATNQLWHAMMLNSMMSAGPQIGVKKGAVQSMNGRNASFSATKPRVWALEDDTQDILKAFSVFIIPNVTDKIMAMYDRAKANADEHTMTPMIAQGEPTQAVPTSSGLAMLMNAANVVTRRLAKGWDDSVTTPVIQSMYDWNMAYNDDESIKGDYAVIARGASHLLIKDVQAQHLQFATQLFSANPMLAPYMKPRVFAERNIEMLDMKPSEFLYTDAQMKQNAEMQGEQPDPELLKAQAAQATAEAALKRAEVEMAIAQDKMQWQREEREIAHMERMADIQARKEIQAMQLEGQRASLIQSMSQMEADERIAMQKIIADLQVGAAKVDLEQFRTESKVRLDAEKIASDERKLEREISVEGKDAKVQ